MDKFAFAASMIGAFVTITGIVWTIIGIRANKQIRNLIVAEKKQFMDRVLDLRTELQSHVDIVIRDREAQSNQKLNTAGIRMERLEAMVKNLDRFAERLRDIS